MWPRKTVQPSMSIYGQPPYSTLIRSTANSMPAPIFCPGHMRTVGSRLNLERPGLVRESQLDTIQGTSKISLPEVRRRSRETTHSENPCRSATSHDAVVEIGSTTLKAFICK